MNKIPIKSAVDANCWLKISNNQEEGFIKVRLTEFRKVLINEIDKPEFIDRQYNLSEGYIYLLKLDVVSFYKQQMGSFYLLSNIIIVDHDDFKFQQIDDAHLSLYSTFALKFALINFFGKILMPKIKYTGAILYFLPKDDEAEYFVTDQAWTICEL